MTDADNTKINSSVMFFNRYMDTHGYTIEDLTRAIVNRDK